ncbi:MAG: hypothetical protein FWG32_02940 [Oscillospiraceae bacterium]|nr:hypothetical protein [Oscillospiraceae bacterium]
MDALMFKKMKVKPGCSAMVFHAPADYPKSEEYVWQNTGKADFIHLFTESREQFMSRFPDAAEACKDNGSFWVSYPKSKGKKVYDINRDSLWGLLQSVGFHPVSQIAPDEEWSALRVKRNEPGVVYEPPGNVKK